MNWSTLLKGTSTTTKKTNVDSLIDWNDVFHTLLSRSIQIIITTVIFFLIWHIGKKLLTKYLLKNPKFQEKMTGRKSTLAHFNPAWYTCWHTFSQCGTCFTSFRDGRPRAC